MEALSAFHFLRPWWLLALPLWLWLSIYVWRKGGQGDGWAAVCDPALLSYLVGESTRTQRSKWVLPVLMLAGCASLLALAGPAWQQQPQPVYRVQSALVIGLDLSRSMLAEDIKPNRLQRAKQKLQDILALRKEGQTALVVFAGDAFDVVPLTSDNKAILAMLDALEPSMMPAQGSRASTALQHALNIFKRSAIKRGTVILLTDGVDADASEIASELVKAGHRVSIIGVGTESGAPIPAFGEAGGFVKDKNGSIVIPRLQTGILQALANAGHGTYALIRFDDGDINAIAGIKTSATDVVSKQEKLQTDLWREEGPWLLLLVLPLLSLAFRRGVLLSLLLLPFVLPAFLLPESAHAMAWKDWWQTQDQQAQALMRDKKPEAAANLFQNPDWKAASLYRAKKYKQAADTLKSVDSADGWYNRGNALAKAGDLKAALDAYDQALKLDSSNDDAAFNRDLVKKAMQKQSKKQSDKSKQSKKQDGDKKKNKQGQNKQGKDQQQGKKQSGQKGGEQKPAGDQSGQQPDQQPGKQNAKQNQPEQQPSQKQGEKKQQPEHSKDQKEQPQAMQSKKDENKQGKQQAVGSPSRADDAKDKEKTAAMQQWLRRIPDDPGGLLRRKFQYQYQQQNQQQNQSNRAGGQLW
ncbi:MAG: VWA domain-containing protein [Mariprofundus sp.]|nr:VWA domain-containing protein [Mariprofundus sp.]